MAAMRYNSLTFAFLPVPILGFLFCLYMSYMYHYNSSVRTHCRGTANFAMSISTAISEPDIAKQVWQSGILIHTPAREKTSSCITNASEIFDLFYT